MAEGWSGWLNAWEQFRSGADEYRELEDGRVLVLTNYGGRGKTSGLEVGEIRTTAASLFDVRDGKVTRFVLYWDRERALTDLGLSTEAGSAGS
jgi:ketosteroid isomerase-like protein